MERPPVDKFKRRVRRRPGTEHASSTTGVARLDGSHLVSCLYQARSEPLRRVTTLLICTYTTYSCLLVNGILARHEDYWLRCTKNELLFPIKIEVSGCSREWHTHVSKNQLPHPPYHTTNLAHLDRVNHHPRDAVHQSGRDRASQHYENKEQIKRPPGSHNALGWNAFQTPAKPIALRGNVVPTAPSETRPNRTHPVGFLARGGGA